MEYPFYLEQKYLIGSGKVEARILTAKEAENMGYEDDYSGKCEGGRVFVDGFNSKESAEAFVKEDLVNAYLVN